MSLPSEVSSFTRYYRATYTQAVVVGLLSFTQPGIWSAIAGLGGGGLATVTTNNTASSILFGVMFVLSPVWAILINKIGIKPVVSIGTLGFVVWSAGLYQNSKDGTQWLIMFGAATCGISAAAFWTAEATVAVLYPSQNERGKFIGIWQLLNKFGGLIAGAVTLALNIDGSTAGSVSLNTYIALIAIQCLGLPISFLLSPPEKVIKKDGSRLRSNVTKEPTRDRILLLFNVLKKKEVLCLVPLMLSCVWFNTWQSNYMTHHFAVRVRALNSLLSALIPGATDIIAGYLLDRKIRKSLKVRVSWSIIVTLMVSFFIYSFIIQAQFDRNPESGIDWSGNPRFAKSFIPFQVFKIAGELVFNWLYWVIGAYHFKSKEIPHVAGWIRSFESLGQCLAFVVGTVNGNDMTNLAVASAVFFCSIPSVTYIAWTVDDNDAHEFIASESEPGTDAEDNALTDSSFKDDKVVVEIDTV